MKIAIASGKGGAGKTTITASLASVWEWPLIAVDLDVEAPNLRLSLRPRIETRDEAFLETPELDPAKCTLCGRCAELCQFKAISLLKSGQGARLLLSADMCHGCGGCFLVCPENALSPGGRLLGVVERGVVDNPGGALVRYLCGELRIGEAMSPPLIRHVLTSLDALLAETASTADSADALLDCPPGVSCPAMCAAEAADVILLVAEPTPFGVHDFALAWEAFRTLGKPMAVAVNRDPRNGSNELKAFCEAKGLPVLCAVPYDRRVAESCADGRVLAATDARHAAIFRDVRNSLLAMADLEVPRA